MTRAARVLLAVVALALGAPAAGAAQQRDPDTIRLASQTAWVGSGGELVLRLDANARRPADVEIAVTVFQRVASRSDFTRTLAGTVRGSALSVATAPLAELTPDPAGAVTVRLPLQSPLLPRDPAKLLVTREGVYPVRVELRERGGGPVLDRFVTHLVHVPNPLEGAKLGVALVVPVHAAPAVSPDGTPDAVGADRARLAVLVRALAAAQATPVVLRPTPETLESLAASTRPEDKEVVATLARALRTRQVLAGPYVPVDVGAMISGGLGDELAAQQTRGNQVLSQVLQLRPDPRTWILDQVPDAGTLQYLRQRQVDRVVLPEKALTPSGTSVTLAQPFTLEARGGRRVGRAVAGDEALAAHLRSPADPVLAAHQFLADLAVIHFDRPGKPRSVAVVPPVTWQPPRALLEVVLDGLATSPIVAGATLDHLFSAVPPATTSAERPLVRRLVARTERQDRLPATDLRGTRARVEAFGGIVDPGNAVYDGLDRGLLTAESSALSTARRSQYVSGVRDRLAAELEKVRMPGNRSITLTARRGEIPVTIQNMVGYPVHAVVRVDSDKLAFPDGDRRTIDLTRRHTTERFTVLARTSGAFPLRVSLESPDGELVMGRSLFTVRSTAASGVGIILSVGAGSFLVLWWARHLLRSRRHGRHLAAL